MSVLGYLLGGSKLKKAKKLTVAAREVSGDQADQLFQEAYTNFSTISASFSNYPDALYNWGFALLHQAQTKTNSEAVKLFEEAIAKFSLCATVAPNHLGAAIDGGVALLGLAKTKDVGLDDELYTKAKESFEKAETVQKGSASYNLACIFALQNEGDACLKALENAREHGLVPDEKDIINDSDLTNVKQLPWFDEFIESLKEEEEEEEKEVVVEAEASDSENTDSES